jgi:hypothetical protein
MEELIEAVSERDALRTIQLLKELVPDYTPSFQVLLHAKSLQRIHGIGDGFEDSIAQSIEPMLVTSK